MAYNEKIYKEYRSRQNTAAKNYESAKREMRKAQNDIKALDKELRDSYSFEKSKAYGAKREVLVERLGKNERLMKQNYKEARKWLKNINFLQFSAYFLQARAQKITPLKNYLKYTLPAAIIILQGPFDVSCKKEECQGKKKAS